MDTTWLGHEFNEKKVKSNIENIKAIPHLKPPTSNKESECFLGALQNIAKFHSNCWKKLIE